MIVDTQFLHDDLKLELSQDKTLITHARTGAARFLGYEITVQHNDRQASRGQRHVNGQIGLRVPRTVIKAKSAYLQRGNPARRTRLLHRDDYDIVAIYGSQYRGIVQCCRPAHPTNAFVERFQGCVLHLHYRTAFRYRFYASAADIDDDCKPGCVTTTSNTRTAATAPAAGSPPRSSTRLGLTCSSRKEGNSMTSTRQRRDPSGLILGQKV
jgi:hypothetical protein